jgi:hypothetical protein
VTANLRTPLASRCAAVLLLAAMSGGVRADVGGDGRAGERPQADDVPGIFASALAPYGEWVRLRDGTRAWRPSEIADDWQPYRDGTWQWTERGWYWVSGEPWAWATYHYGGWRFDARVGWAWVPGTTWAPARVTWRYGAGVVGWAPDTGGHPVLPPHWVFLPARRFAGVPVADAALPAPRVPATLVRTRVARWSAGPRPSRGAAVEIPIAEDGAVVASTLGDRE